MGLGVPLTSTVRGQAQFGPRAMIAEVSDFSQALYQFERRVLERVKTGRAVASLRGYP